MSEQYDEQLLLGYVEGDLSAADRARVDAWVEADPGLRRLLEQMAADRDLLASLPDPAPPAWLMDEVDRQLERSMLVDDADFGGQTVVMRQRNVVRRVVMSGVIAAMLALVGAVVISSLLNVETVEQDGPLLADRGNTDTPEIPSDNEAAPLAGARVESEKPDATAAADAPARTRALATTPAAEAEMADRRTVDSAELPASAPADADTAVAGRAETTAGDAVAAVASRGRATEPTAGVDAASATEEAQAAPTETGVGLATNLGQASARTAAAKEMAERLAAGEASGGRQQGEQQLDDFVQRMLNDPKVATDLELQVASTHPRQTEMLLASLADDVTKGEAQASDAARRFEESVSRAAFLEGRELADEPAAEGDIVTRTYELTVPRSQLPAAMAELARDPRTAAAYFQQRPRLAVGRLPKMQVGEAWYEPWPSMSPDFGAIMRQQVPVERVDAPADELITIPVVIQLQLKPEAAPAEAPEAAEPDASATGDDR